MNTRWTCTRWLVGAVLLACAPVASATAQTPVDDIGDSATTAAVQRVLVDAERQGLPLGPLVLKVREGTAKRASSARLLQALSQLAARLGDARSALPPGRTERELAAAAEALQAGVTPAQLTRIGQRAAQQSLTVPLGVLTQLIAAGVPKARAVTLVEALLARGATIQQLVALGDAVESDIVAGLAAPVAFSLRSNGLLESLPPLGTTAANGSPTGTPRGPQRLRPTP